MMEREPPTLEAYYQLLPEEVRKRPGVVSAYLVLEKRAYYLTLKEK